MKILVVLFLSTALMNSLQAMEGQTEITQGSDSQSENKTQKPRKLYQPESLSRASSCHS